MNRPVPPLRPDGHGAPPPGGLDDVRLLADWYATGRPATLADHLERHGPPPVTAAGGSPPSVPLVEAVEAAGLTGRGGAGFPTARKLRAVAGRRRRAVVVVNAMESEPASRKDQFLLAVAPHLVLDGAVLAASAVGADTVHVCLPRDRPAQYRRMDAALDERRRARLDRVRLLAHALPHTYVSSESTALVHWLNGGPARPQGGPPGNRERGVDRRPTLVSNAETLAHLALIARHGPGWFRRLGTRGRARHPCSSPSPAPSPTRAFVRPRPVPPLATLLGRARRTDRVAVGRVLARRFFSAPGFPGRKHCTRPLARCVLLPLGLFFLFFF
ncbi:LOW QUALITY PROTEIN: NADH-ubiquinone dehydrogenase chain F, partial [Streptomyces griseoflavus Tu4000]